MSLTSNFCELCFLSKKGFKMHHSLLVTSNILINLGYSSRKGNVHSIKSNKLLKSEDLDIKVFNYLKGKITIENVFTFYVFADTFKLNNLSKITLRYIQRCFTMTTDTENFLNLEFRSVGKIISSSELNITSELEIFRVVQAWISYNKEERSKYSKDLLLKVRIPLLSENELKYINKLSFDKNKYLHTLTNDLLKQGCFHFDEKSPAYFTNRHCTQSEFNILLCCGADLNKDDLVFPSDEEDEEEDEAIVAGQKQYDIISTDINQLSLKNLNSYKTIGSMPKERFYTNMIFCRGELYFFSGCNEYDEMSSAVEKYSMVTNSSKIIPGVHFHLNHYCFCNFMDEIYFLGGFVENVATDACVKFDTKANKFENVAKMNSTRALAACAVFKGNIVVSGGLIEGLTTLKSVEVYDYSADEWKYMPSMVHGRSHHSLAATRNKLFAIGGFKQQCEVFDSTSNAFALMKNSKGFDFSGNENWNKTLVIGNKIFVFFEHRSTALCYDLEKGNWTKESCEITKNYFYFGCAKVPVFNTFVK